MAAVTVYQIWGARNQFVHQRKQVTAIEIVAELRRSMYEATLSWEEVPLTS